MFGDLMSQPSVSSSSPQPRQSAGDKAMRTIVIEDLTDLQVVELSASVRRFGDILGTDTRVVQGKTDLLVTFYDPRIAEAASITLRGEGYRSFLDQISQPDISATLRLSNVPAELQVTDGDFKPILNIINACGDIFRISRVDNVLHFEFYDPRAASQAVGFCDGLQIQSHKIKASVSPDSSTESLAQSPPPPQPVNVQHVSRQMERMVIRRNSMPHLLVRQHSGRSLASQPPTLDAWDEDSVATVTSSWRSSLNSSPAIDSGNLLQSLSSRSSSDLYKGANSSSSGPLSSSSSGALPIQQQRPGSSLSTISNTSDSDDVLEDLPRISRSLGYLNQPQYQPASSMSANSNIVQSGSSTSLHSIGGSTGSIPEEGQFRRRGRTNSMPSGTSVVQQSQSTGSLTDVYGQSPSSSSGWSTVAGSGASQSASGSSGGRPRSSNSRTITPFFGSIAHGQGAVKPPPVRDEGRENFRIDVNKIDMGEETRTTLMIRNIPNKYDQATLLELIDITHRGTYSFFYLPIDFETNGNPGYAFIDFFDPKSIISLYTRMHGKKWTKFNSEKQCQLSFAKYQGLAQLSRHFRKSNIMKQPVEHRPLFFSSPMVMDSFMSSEPAYYPQHVN